MSNSHVLNVALRLGSCCAYVLGSQLIILTVNKSLLMMLTATSSGYIRITKLGADQV